MIEKYKQLFVRTAKILSGNFLAKILQFLLLAYYTRVLSPSQYGKVEFIYSFLQLLTILLSLQISEGIFRFLKEAKNKRQLLGIISKYNIVINILFPTTLVVLTKILKLNYSIFKEVILCLAITSGIYLENLKQVLRGLERMTFYSISILLEAILFWILNIIFIKKYSYFGIFFARVVTNFSLIILMTFTGSLYKYIFYRKVNLKILKELLQYSIPFIPNAFIFWFLTLSDRYILKYYEGFEAIGIYTIATKIPIIISTVVSFFILSWQASAIDEYRKNTYKEFHNKIFNCFKILLFVGSISLNLILDKFLKVFVGQDFLISKSYIYFLNLGVIFFCLSSFIEVNYIVKKRTKKMILSVIIGGIINILLNILLIKEFSIKGAIMTNIISYFIIFLIRIYDTKKITDLRLDKNFILEIFIYLGFCFYLSEVKSLILKICGYFLVIILICVLNRKFIKDLNRKRRVNE